MKKIESGRSMIEMLGVLAIIGVLSIGGLAAYTMAMDRNAANGVLDYAAKASLRATEIKAAGKTITVPTDNTFYGITKPTEVSAVALTLDAESKATGYTITVNEDIYDIVNGKVIENITWDETEETE